MCSSNCKIILTLLSLIFTVFVARASDIREDMPVDTLLNASSASSIAISYAPESTSIQVNNINGTDDNFYFKSGKDHMRLTLGASGRTSVNCSDITNVTIVESRTTLCVEFTTCDGETASYDFAFVDPDNRSFTSYVGRRASDFGFTISKTGRVTWECVSQGLGIGWVDAVRENPETGTSMWRSYEFTWLMTLGVRMSWSRHHSLACGLGLHWQNFHTRKPWYFHKNPDGRISLEPYDEGVTNHRSRIQLFSLQVPFIYSLSFGHKERVYAKIGPIVCFNVGGNIMTEYDYEGREYSIKTGRIGQRPVTVDGIFSMGYGGIGVYVRYSPMSKMRTSSGLNFGSLSTGIVVAF